MAKFVNNDVLDGALNIVATATRMVALSGQPAAARAGCTRRHYHPAARR